MFRITALMDDRAGEHKALTAEHGLSFYIEYEGKRLLFDTGATGTTLQNARRLGIDLSGLDAVVLSHSHYDHAGGYWDLVDAGLGSRVLVTGPHFFEPKYAVEGVRCTDLSAGFDEAFLAGRGIDRRVVTGKTELFPGVTAYTDFPRVHDFETIPARFMRRAGDAFVRDTFPDEICLAFRTDGGTVLTVGCSHPGILNMLDRVREDTGAPIRAVFGGTHLMEANEERVARTLARMKELGVQIVGLSHCSGESAFCAIREDPEIEGCHLGTGDTVFF